MADPGLTVTTTALLDALFRREDRSTWNAFDERFRPVLVGVARGLGLGPEDAADVAQETLAQVVQGYRDGRYARARGRLRSWMLAILRNRAVDLRRRRVPEALGSRSGLAAPPGEDELDRLWETEYRRKLLADALSMLRASRGVRPGEVEQFVAHAIEERGAQEVADEHGVSLWTVYRATKKCSGLLREAVETLERNYEAG